jgi:acetate kinase
MPSDTEPFTAVTLNTPITWYAHPDEPARYPSDPNYLNPDGTAKDPADKDVCAYDSSGTLLTGSTYMDPMSLIISQMLGYSDNRTTDALTRRYGFNGLAHQYSVLRYGELTGTAKERVNLVTIHLGNGCSACAIRGGESLDTSMGFTPLEGLVMGTRSGDLDPALVSYLAQEEKVDAAEVEHWLNKRSGLLGISGLSSDMRELMAAYDTNPRARLAVEVFCYRARKYLGAYLAVVGEAEAVIFSGGIGENSPVAREKICQNMEWFGSS